MDWKELAHEDAQKYMSYWYERAVDEQRAELWQFKKKEKTQAQIQIEPMPLNIESIKED